jgi:glycosyltransferase involved in cell wall biosynthesis
VSDLVKITFFLIRFRNNTILHYITGSGFATYRTLIVSLFAKILSIPLVLDARGNSLNKFAEGNERSPLLISWKLILGFSKSILVQQRSTHRSLRDQFGKKVIHHPNPIKKRQSNRKNEILQSGAIKIVFVGYCYEKKGVFDLVEGCNIASGNDIKIELSLIGKEEHSFSAYLNDFKSNLNLIIKRFGKQNFDFVQRKLCDNDIFIFPSFHPGEGHPNIINEAISAELALITAKVGTITEFLSDEKCYFIEQHSADDIADKIQYVLKNPIEAKEKANEALRYLKLNFSENVVYGELFKIYNNIIRHY